MPSIRDLKPFYDENELDKSFNSSQIDNLYRIFTDNFIDNNFLFEGKQLKIFPGTSKISQYSKYCETFVHIISRHSHIAGERVYDCHRLNRSHWIKPILESYPNSSIKYYRWKDNESVCKHHYWFYDKDFMVVLKDIGSMTAIVTCFCVDADEKLKFYERFSDFRDGKDCL